MSYLVFPILFGLLNTIVNYVCSVANSICFCSILIVTAHVSSPTLNLNLTLFVVSCKLFLGIIYL